MHEQLVTTLRTHPRLFAPLVVMNANLDLHISVMFLVMGCASLGLELQFQGHGIKDNVALALTIVCIATSVILLLRAMESQELVRKSLLTHNEESS